MRIFGIGQLRDGARAERVSSTTCLGRFNVDNRLTLDAATSTDVVLELGVAGQEVKSAMWVTQIR